MELFKNIRNGIITTLFGLVVLGITVHQYLDSGIIDYQNVLLALLGSGLLVSKDPTLFKK